MINFLCVYGQIKLVSHLYKYCFYSCNYYYEHRVIRQENVIACIPCMLFVVRSRFLQVWPRAVHMEGRRRKLMNIDGSLWNFSVQIQAITEQIHDSNIFVRYAFCNKNVAFIFTAFSLYRIIRFCDTVSEQVL